MIDAIIYNSNAGHTKAYAQMLSDKLGVEAYPLKEAKKNVKKKSNVIFMTWIKNGKLVDLKKARGKYNLKAICGVGMNYPGKGITSTLQNKNKINALKEKFFYLQGGFDIDRLSGANKMIMTALQKSLSKIEEAKTLPKDQKEILQMMRNKLDCVKVNNIKEVYSWYNREFKK